jgi:hypothetical protein
LRDSPILASSGSTDSVWAVVLLPCRLLDGAKHSSYLALEGWKVEVDDAAARVKNHVDRCIERRKIVAYGLAHATLDAIAVDGLAHHFANGEAYAWAIGVDAAEEFTVRAQLWPQTEKVAHLLPKLLATRLVNALVVRVFAKPEDRVGGGGHRSRCGDITCFTYGTGCWGECETLPFAAIDPSRTCFECGR